MDTNTCLYFLQPEHAYHQVTSEALSLLVRKREGLCVAPQNLVEIWAVATRPIKNSGLGFNTAQSAEALHRVRKLFAVLAETDRILPAWEQLVINHRVSGKATHDARLVAAMRVHGLSSILTFNTSDFLRYPGMEVINPIDLVPAVAP